jgi:hydroxymethylpyrimidine pyrophosphatase-like HAD family hydrolase
MYLAIDFDGTCVTHEYPKVGRDIGAQRVLKQLTEKGHKLILNTMRSDKYLKDAEEWFEKNDIPLFASNLNPTQYSWTNSPKVYANIYIDDASLGIPLIKGPNDDRAYVDWLTVESMLKESNVL